MPRKNRIHYSEALYHVMLRGNYRQHIFVDRKYYLYFYQLLEKATKQFNCKVHLFCLMTNHVHLVIEIKHIPLAKIIQFITSCYARFNHKHTNRVGHLFQGRYKAKLIQNEEYLHELCYYIHNNPLKAQLVSNLDGYPWSSHLAYSGKETIAWLTTNYLEQLIQKNIGSKVNAYISFMDRKKERQTGAEYCKFDEEGLLIIKDSIIKKINERKTLSLNHLTIDKIAKFICDVMEVDFEEIVSPSLNKKIILSRSIITYFSHYCVFRSERTLIPV